MNIGRKIADGRRAKNLTQEQLAELMKVTRQTVSRWESQTAYPEMEKIVNLAAILEVSCDYLLNDKIETPAGIGAAPGSGAESGSSGALTGSAAANPVTRLLAEAKGRTVRIQLMADGMDDLHNKKAVIVDFDGSWAHVAYKSGKKTETSLVPVSAIRSIKFEKEEVEWNISALSDLFSL